MNFSLKRVSKGILRLALMVVLCACPESRILCQESSTGPVFSSPVLDLGMVVQDLDASAAFYGKVLGCKEVTRVFGGQSLCNLHWTGRPHGCDRPKCSCLRRRQAKPPHQDDEFPQSQSCQIGSTIHSFNAWIQLPDLACDEPGCVHEAAQGCKNSLKVRDACCSGRQQCIACGSGSRWKLCRIDWSSSSAAE